MIGIPEILYIATVISGSAVYAAYMSRAPKSQNAANPPSSPSPSQEKKKDGKKLEKVEEAQSNLTEKVEVLTNKLQDLEQALKLKPEEQKPEMKDNGKTSQEN
jgi:predicted RNase H-like nuclease (RuvC/YqgF family)